MRVQLNEVQLHLVSNARGISYLGSVARDSIKRTPIML